MVVFVVGTVHDVQWAVEAFSLSEVDFSLIWVWVLGAERGQIPLAVRVGVCGS